MTVQSIDFSKLSNTCRYILWLHPNWGKMFKKSTTVNFWGGEIDERLFPRSGFKTNEQRQSLLQALTMIIVQVTHKAQKLQWLLLESDLRWTSTVLMLQLLNRDPMHLGLICSSGFDCVYWLNNEERYLPCSLGETSLQLLSCVADGRLLWSTKLCSFPWDRSCIHMAVCYASIRPQVYGSNSDAVVGLQLRDSCIIVLSDLYRGGEW